MKRSSSPAARQVLALFADAPLADRLHVRARWLTAPFVAVEQLLPRRGRILEVGSGHGLFCLYGAVCSPDREMVGVDIDADKVAHAIAAASKLASDTIRPTFSVVRPGELPPGPFDAIAINDVLYLMDGPTRSATLDACVERLTPEGVLVVKELDVVPRWKYRLAYAQEIVATRVLRYTEGEAMAITPLSIDAEHLRNRDMQVDEARIDQGYLHPHAVIIARRPSKY